jgi:cell division protein FtsL
VRRSFAVALGCAALLVLGALTVVGLRVQEIHLGYELDRLKTERARLEQMVRELEIEMATLRAPARIESRARELGMVPPARGQVRLAREYVAGSTGLAGERHRVASLSGAANAAPISGHALSDAPTSGHPSSDAPVSGHPRPDPAWRHPLQQ